MDFFTKNDPLEYIPSITPEESLISAARYHNSGNKKCLLKRHCFDIIDTIEGQYPIRMIPVRTEYKEETDTESCLEDKHWNEDGISCVEFTYTAVFLFPYIETLCEDERIRFIEITLTDGGVDPITEMENMKMFDNVNHMIEFLEEPTPYGRKSLLEHLESGKISLSDSDKKYARYLDDNEAKKMFYEYSHLGFYLNRFPHEKINASEYYCQLLQTHGRSIDDKVRKILLMN